MKKIPKTMKASIKIILIVLLGWYMSAEPCQAQKKFSFKKGKELLKKAKTLSEPETVTETKEAPPSDSQNEVNGLPNSGGKKRKLTPPDVNEQIRNARAAFSDKSYTESRFYIQQAIIGIELDIGYKILESMPEIVSGHQADKSQDEVYSTGAGFAGMSISRQYPSDNGYIKASVANSSILAGTAQFAVSSAAMNGYDDNTKVTRYKGYKTILEADDYSGYKMSVPFGQSSVFILECGTCESEDQLMKVADLYDIDEYKTLLGEQ